MYHPQLLKAMLVAHGSSAADLSFIIGKGIDATRRKINGETEFTRAEMSRIKDKFALSVDEMNAIFFA